MEGYWKVIPLIKGSALGEEWLLENHPFRDAPLRYYKCRVIIKC